MSLTVLLPAAPLTLPGLALGAAMVAMAAAFRRAKVDRASTITLDVPAGASCAHLGQVRPVRPSADGCEECLKIGGRWLHLRICMTCGHVGCCDSSPNRHATRHHEATEHPVMRSLEPGEAWGWCYVDGVML